MDAKRWQEVLDYPLDDPTAPRPFSVRLRDANEWTDAFTQEAILEYRKFMYLKTVTEQPLTPSVVVDSVWHMHILYLRNYLHFCKTVIGRIVYHDPGKGGEGDAGRFQSQYADTLECYRDNFGEPPAHIWRQTSRRLDTGSADN